MFTQKKKYLLCERKNKIFGDHFFFISAKRRKNKISFSCFFTFLFFTKKKK